MRSLRAVDWEGDPLFQQVPPRAVRMAALKTVVVTTVVVTTAIWASGEDVMIEVWHKA